VNGHPVAATEGGIVPRLILIKGTDDGKQFELTQSSHSVGRDSGSSIRLVDTEVSRRHAEFRLVNGAWHLIDIGSANGTFVNGQPVKDAALQPGDRIQIGQSILVFSLGRSEPGKGESDLAERISMITRHDMELSSAIIKTIGESEGSRILAQPEQVKGPWLKSALANLGVVYEAIQAVSHILDVDELLARIMELIFKSIEADRGCILLHNPEGGALEPRSVRWRRVVPPEERMTISTTVVEYIQREKQGILVSDAARDERFATGQSIVRFGIREVICVPMKGRHETIGVLYLDTVSNVHDVVASGSPTGKFTEDHLALAIAIAHQAALAVEETRYHEAMVQAERLAAIGQTIAALSHHIKNILQGLRSGSEILNMGLADKDESLLEKGWKIVQKNQGKISDLVMDMLSYSKEREPLIEEADLNAVAREVLEVLEGRRKETGVRVQTKLEPLPSAQVDVQGIHHALLNIVGNAFDAVEERPDPRVGVATGLEPDGAWVRILVVDNGGGIPPEKLKDIFKPFISSKGAKGTGLGLPVSRKILREHGGDILVESTPGKGSRIVLRLPLKSPLSQDLNSSTTSELPSTGPPEPE
jgi:signal transduction histidine kinase/pSer/pThr/pTyr-binding forkhead associated (FHA) protein